MELSGIEPECKLLLTFRLRCLCSFVRVAYQLHERGFLLPGTTLPIKPEYNAPILCWNDNPEGERCLGSQSERRHKVHSSEVWTHDRCFSMYQSPRFKVFSEYHRNARMLKNNLSKPDQSRVPAVQTLLRQNNHTLCLCIWYPRWHSSCWSTGSFLLNWCLWHSFCLFWLNIWIFHNSDDLHYLLIKTDLRICWHGWILKYQTQQ